MNEAHRQRQLQRIAAAIEQCDAPAAPADVERARAEWERLRAPQAQQQVDLPLEGE